MKSKLLVAALTAILSTTSVAVPAAMAHAGEVHAAVPQVAEGKGIVKAINAKAGTITIAHGPMPALKWPSMTMKFKVEKPSVLKGVTVGKNVHFVLKNVGGKPVVSVIHVL